MTIDQHAQAREAAWLAVHPDGHEYEGKDLMQEAMEELADCWNYIGASSLPPGTVATLRRQLAAIYEELQ